MSEERKPALLRRSLVAGAWVAVAATALVAAVAAWLLATASGAQFVLGHAVPAAGGSIGTVQGRLVGPLAVDALEIATPAFRLRARQLAIDWSPLRLLAGELRVESLHAVSLDIATAPSKEPAREPVALAPPMRLHVGRAAVDRLRVAAMGDDRGGVELREVSLQLAADRNRWILDAGQASTPVGRARLAGTVGAAAPFPLSLEGELAGTRGDSPYRATVAAAGTLASIDIAIAAREGGLAGNANARIEPFKAVPVRRLEAKLAGLDLAAFAAAPRTRLTVEADLAPREGAMLAGTVRIANAEPGPLDEERLPIESATAQIAVTANRIEATKLAAVASRGGRAEGAAAWSGGKLDARIVVADLDLLALHTALRATRLAGEITAVATGDSQSYAVALTEPRFEVRAAARVAGGTLSIERAKLTRGAALVEASGSLALAGARDFRAEGRIERLDPSAFARVPAGDLNASFSAKGSLAKQLTGEVALEIARSRYAGLAAAGRLFLAADGSRVTRVDADITLGATRLLAKGSLGAANDTLEMKLASADLAPLGHALGRAIGGSVDLDATVTGAYAALSGRAAIDAKNLLLPGALRVTEVTGRVELGAGDAGLASGEVVMLGLAKQGERTAMVERASLAIDGTRRAHELRVAVQIPDQFTAQALLAGGVVPGARVPEWHGRLESLSTAGVTDVALSAPATLLVSTERVELGEALFAGEPGQIRLALTRWTPAGLEARGSSNAVVVRSVRQMLDMQGGVGSNLVLAGEWDLRVGDTVDGFVAIRRERGDVRVGEPWQALGLEVLALRADAHGGLVRATAEIRGRQLGLWKGEGSATLARGGQGWAIAPTAPIEGRFTIDVPDLAWMAGWIGPEARTGGRLTGEGTVSGTRLDPAWRGRIEATGLAIRDPALGAEVADGTIAISLTDREARIERLALSMPWKPSPDAARAIAAARRPSAGTVTAEGSVDLGTRKGSVRVKADAWPLSSLATRFLAVTGEGRVDLDGTTTAMAGNFAMDAGWFGIPASAPPSLSDDVVVIRGEAPPAARGAERYRLDLRVDLGEQTYFAGRGLSTRLVGALRLAGDLGANLRSTGTIRAVGGTYEAYGRTLTLERGALNFQGPIDNPGINVLALRKGLPVEAGVEVVGTVARPRVRLYSSPDVPESEKLAWLVLGRGKGDVSAADAATLVGAASALLGEGQMPASRVSRGLGLDELSIGADQSGILGTMPQSTVAGRTGSSSSAEVVTVGKQITDDIRVSYRQGLADAEGSFRVTFQLTKSLRFILRAGYQPGIDAAYRFTFE